MRAFRTGALVGSAVSLLGVASGQGPAAPTSSRVIWTGIHTDVRTGPDCNWQVVQTFEFVGEPPPDGEDASRPGPK